MASSLQYTCGSNSYLESAGDRLSDIKLIFRKWEYLLHLLGTLVPISVPLLVTLQKYRYRVLDSLRIYYMLSTITKKQLNHIRRISAGSNHQHKLDQFNSTRWQLGPVKSDQSCRVFHTGLSAQSA